VETPMIKGNIDVQDIAINELALVGNAVANYLVWRGTDRFWKVVIIKG
jgi:hypothetical protein